MEGTYQGPKSEMKDDKVIHLAIEDQDILDRYRASQPRHTPTPIPPIEGISKNSGI